MNGVDRGNTLMPVGAVDRIQLNACRASMNDVLSWFDILGLHKACAFPDIARPIFE